MAEAAGVLTGGYGYLGNTSFNVDKKFLWQKRQFYNILVVKGAADLPSTDGAVLTAVGQLSDNRFYLRPDGGYQKPTAYTPSLAAAKGSGTVVAPVCAPFAEHWKIVLSNLGLLAATVATPGVPFKGALDDGVSFKVKYEPFIVSLWVVLFVYLDCAPFSHYETFRRRMDSSKRMMPASVLIRVFSSDWCFCRD